MFFGQYEHTFDDKSRITLPARFRDALAKGVVLSRGIDRNVDVYPRDVWESVVRGRLAELDAFSRETRDLRRFIFSGASDSEQDKQGRVHVPAMLVEHASLGKEVLVAGVDDHLEIWDRSVWAERLIAVGGSVDDVAERFAERRN